MIVLGISPLDKDATVSVVQDGELLFAAAEERFSRVKQHSGFPFQALADAFAFTGLSPDDIQEVAYAFLPWQGEQKAISGNWGRDESIKDLGGLRDLERRASERRPDRPAEVHGLDSPGQVFRKPISRRWLHGIAGGYGFVGRMVAAANARKWYKATRRGHQHWQKELIQGLEKHGLADRLRHYDHHLSHAANAYFCSDFDRALAVTLDGYGTGLCGAVNLIEGGRFRRLGSFPFPSSLGMLYEHGTSALGFVPDRHAGKIVGLAAYGDPSVLSDVLLHYIDMEKGEFRIARNFNHYVARRLASSFSMIDVAAAFQYVLERVATETIRYWVNETGCGSIALSGGVAANVKMNQRILETEGVKEVFVYPNMGDGGCGSGLGYYVTTDREKRSPISTAYLGPRYSDRQLEAALDGAGVEYERPNNLAKTIADAIHGGNVVARFDGRMEYGPRALGNRSILYHAREPGVNQWLNGRLGRTEFMPFAPVTMYEHADKCYVGWRGAALSAEFMTITFDCTPWMRAECPAAVHIDGTARPQLIKREANPGYYDILHEYFKLSGIPCLINTSFNMHEEPIVCSPDDAIRAFQQGDLDALALGPFFVRAPRRTT